MTREELVELNTSLKPVIRFGKDEDMCNLAIDFCLITGLTIMYGRTLEDNLEDKIAHVQESVWESLHKADKAIEPDVARALLLNADEIKQVYAEIVQCLKV